MGSCSKGGAHLQESKTETERWKAKTQTTSLYVRELLSLSSCDQWHRGLETFVTLAGILNYNGHKLSPPLKPHGVVDAH